MLPITQIYQIRCVWHGEQLSSITMPIEENDQHLATGSLSIHKLLRILTDNGRPDVAMKLLLQNS
jgi:hypothetical protein